VQTYMSLPSTSFSSQFDDVNSSSVEAFSQSLTSAVAPY
jgi:hypothetical protein